MKKKCLLALVVFLSGILFAGSAYSFELGGKNLVNMGTGSRTMAILGTVYDASLWIPEELNGSSAKDIIEADEPSVVTIKITSRLISRNRFVSAVSEGFEKAEASNYGTDKADQFLALFDDLDINNGDQIDIYYIPGSGVETNHLCSRTNQSQVLGTIDGLDLKQALYAIWLGPDPVQASLRDGMLGKN